MQAKADSLVLRPGAPETPIWSLGSPETAFRRGDTVEAMFANELPQPAALNLRGLDGVPGAEPLISRAPLASGTREALQLPLRPERQHAPLLLCARLFYLKEEPVPVPTPHRNRCSERRHLAQPLR